jgi:hypothetical protein
MGLINRTHAAYDQTNNRPMMQVAGQNHDGNVFLQTPLTQPVTLLGAAHSPITTPIAAMTESSATRQASLPPFMVSSLTQRV